MDTNRQVTEHYTRDMLEQTMLDALRSAGKNVDQLTIEDLEPFDNLHLGGRASIDELAQFMAVRAGMHLLDVGSGVGGPARYFAARGCQVTGVDLTPEFVRLAESLTNRLKLGANPRFRQGSALATPFSPRTFDGAYMIHVGMNIADKAGLFREVARVLKQGAKFAIFDIMRVGNEPLEFPLPWATDAGASFVDTAENYRQALETSGFRVEHQRGRRQFALETMEKMRAQASGGAPPVLGVHVLMGEKAPLMLKNVNTAIAAGKLEPVEIVAVLE